MRCDTRTSWRIIQRARHKKCDARRQTQTDERSGRSVGLGLIKVQGREKVKGASNGRGQRSVNGRAGRSGGYCDRGRSESKVRTWRATRQGQGQKQKGRCEATVRLAMTGWGPPWHGHGPGTAGSRPRLRWRRWPNGMPSGGRSHIARSANREELRSGCLVGDWLSGIRGMPFHPGPAGFGSQPSSTSPSSPSRSPSIVAPPRRRRPHCRALPPLPWSSTDTLLRRGATAARLVRAKSTRRASSRRVVEGRPLRQIDLSIWRPCKDHIDIELRRCRSVRGTRGWCDTVEHRRRCGSHDPHEPLDGSCQPLRHMSHRAMIVGV